MCFNDFCVFKVEKHGVFFKYDSVITFSLRSGLSKAIMLT